MMDYIIATGYHARPGRGQDWFWHLWFENTMQFSNPSGIVVLSCAGSRVDLTDKERMRSEWIHLAGNLGHTGDLLGGSKPYRFCGCLAGMMQLALTAYCNETDFVYKEQDCLAFGPYIERMYAEIGSHGVIFGIAKLMGASLSLLLVRHAFIPDFVRLYLGTNAENMPFEMPERKFLRLMAQHPDLYGTYSFGVDRDRPLPLEQPDQPWYAQKFTPEELRQVSAIGLINAVDIPPITNPTFSNA